MVKKALLGMFLALFAMVANADASTMLFRVSNMGGGTFAGSPITSSDVFWLKLEFADVAASVPGTTVATSFDSSSRLYRVGNWADDTTFWSVNTGASSISFSDFGGTGPEILNFDVSFVNGQRLVYNYTKFVGTPGQNNEISSGNIWKFLNSLGNPNALVDGSLSTSNFDPAGVKAIPEPGSMALLGLLSSGLGFVAVRRRKTLAK